MEYPVTAAGTLALCLAHQPESTAVGCSQGQGISPSQKGIPSDPLDLRYWRPMGLVSLIVPSMPRPSMWALKPSARHFLGAMGSSLLLSWGNDLCGMLQSPVAHQKHLRTPRSQQRCPPRTLVEAQYISFSEPPLALNSKGPQTRFLTGRKQPSTGVYSCVTVTSSCHSLGLLPIKGWQPSLGSRC